MRRLLLIVIILCEIHLLLLSRPRPSWEQLRWEVGQTGQLWSDKQRETSSGTGSGPSSCFTSNLPNDKYTYIYKKEEVTPSSPYFNIISEAFHRLQQPQHH